MSSKIYSVTLIGLEAHIVEVEVYAARGKNAVNIVGLPDKAVSEAKERIVPALKNSNCVFPKGKITVNLAPANIPKYGSLYDLPIAISVLKHTGQITGDFKKSIFIGELSLEGELREISGIISMIDGLKEKGFNKFFVPEVNKKEAGLVSDIEIYPVENINAVINHFNGVKIKQYNYENYLHGIETPTIYDFKHIKGQVHVKRALTIAAAGGHNCLLTGTPGSGKTYLSRALPSILPPMDYAESIEVTRIYSISGKLKPNTPLITERPFRSPHHTSSQVALVGGGSIPKPGEVTLAHRGILFLDEFAEFPQKCLDSLRQPIEDGIVSISRANSTITFPAKFMLIAAMNPCKCGYFGDPDKECTCTPSDYLKYQRRISGPILDRIDLQVKVPRLKTDKLLNSKEAESSKDIKEKVINARQIQLERFKEIDGVFTNSEMHQSIIKSHIQLNKKSLDLLKNAIDALNLSARGYFRILKIARTIADLEASETVNQDHISESLSYRFTKM